MNNSPLTPLLANEVKPSTLVLTGFLGTGKTTFLLKYLQQRTREELSAIRIIINDAGDENVDAKILQAVFNTADIADLRAGCIGCEDKKSFLHEIESARNAGKNIIIEPSGLIDGSELDEALPDSVNYPRHVLCLVRAELISFLTATQELKEVFKSQLAIADTVAISQTNEWNSEVYEVTQGHILSIRKELQGCIHPLLRDSISEELLGSIHATRQKSQSPALMLPILPVIQTCNHTHHHHHNHNELHGGLHVQSAHIPTDMTPEALEQVCSNIPQLVRMKCLGNGFIAHISVGKFDVDILPQITSGLGNFFTKQKLDDNFIQNLLGEVRTNEAVAQWFMSKVPHFLAENGDIQVIGDRDWTALQLALEEDFDPKVRIEIVTQYLTRRIEMAKYLEKNRTTHETSNKFGFWLRWLGGEMALRAEQCKEELPTIYSDVQACNPVLVWLEGMEELTELSLDPEDSVENPEMIAVFLLPYLHNADSGIRSRIMAVVEQCISLSEDDNTVQKQWQVLREKIT